VLASARLQHAKLNCYYRNVAENNVARLSITSGKTTKVSVCRQH